MPEPIQRRPAPARPSPASEKGLRTRDQILRSAVAVFGRRGFTRTTMLEIAQEANVASGTVYQYFSDKADLFGYLLEVLRAKLHDETRMPADPDGRLLVHDSVLRYLEVYREHAAIYRAWWELLEPRTDFTEAWLALHEKSRREMIRAIDRGKATNIVPDDVDPGLTADLMLAMFDRPAYLRIVMGWDDELTDEVMADRMSRLLGHGLDR
jgi:AcrR family transcriptional regulator